MRRFALFVIHCFAKKYKPSIVYPAKLKDIKSMMNLFPKVHQEFYKGFFAEDSVEDDHEAYGGPIGFDIKVDDGNVD